MLPKNRLATSGRPRSDNDESFISTFTSFDDFDFVSIHNLEVEDESSNEEEGEDLWEKIMAEASSQPSMPNSSSSNTWMPPANGQQHLTNNNWNNNNNGWMASGGRCPGQEASKQQAMLDTSNGGAWMSSANGQPPMTNNCYNSGWANGQPPMLDNSSSGVWMSSANGAQPMASNWNNNGWANGQQQPMSNNCKNSGWMNSAGPAPPMANSSNNSNGWGNGPQPVQPVQPVQSVQPVANNQCYNNGWANGQPPMASNCSNSSWMASADGPSPMSNSSSNSYNQWMNSANGSTPMANNRWNNNNWANGQPPMTNQPPMANNCNNSSWMASADGPSPITNSNSNNYSQWMNSAGPAPMGSNSGGSFNGWANGQAPMGNSSWNNNGWAGQPSMADSNNRSNCGWAGQPPIANSNACPGGANGQTPMPSNWNNKKNSGWAVTQPPMASSSNRSNCGRANGPQQGPYNWNKCGCKAHGQPPMSGNSKNNGWAKGPPSTTNSGGDNKKARTPSTGKNSSGNQSGGVSGLPPMGNNCSKSGVVAGPPPIANVNSCPGGADVQQIMAYEMSTSGCKAKAAKPKKFVSNSSSGSGGSGSTVRIGASCGDDTELDPLASNPRQKLRELKLQVIQKVCLSYQMSDGEGDAECSTPASVHTVSFENADIEPAPGDVSIDVDIDVARLSEEDTEPITDVSTEWDDSVPTAGDKAMVRYDESAIMYQGSDEIVPYQGPGISGDVDSSRFPLPTLHLPPSPSDVEQPKALLTDSLWDAISDSNTTAVRKLLASGADPNVPTEQGSRLLFRAVIKARDASIVKLLLAHKADPLASDVHGNQVMHFWVRSTLADRTQLFEMARSLAVASADLNAGRDKDGMAPLHHLTMRHNSRRGWLDFHKALLLVRMGANTAAVTHDGEMPHHLIRDNARVATQRLRALLTEDTSRFDWALPRCNAHFCAWCSAAWSVCVDDIPRAKRVAIRE